MNFNPITTRRLLLRRFETKDVSAFHAYRNDPKVARYQGWESCTTEEAQEFVMCQASQPFGIPGEWLQIAIAMRATDQMIGDCAVRIHAQDARQATFGVTFSRVSHGKGFAVEALTALFDHLFLDLHLHRIVADADVENIAAWKLAEQLGMRREGHLRQSLWFKGRWADEYYYAILRDEWLARSEPKHSVSNDLTATNSHQARP